MYRNLFRLMAVAILFPSCSRTTPHIAVVCEENSVGNSIVKWEMMPSVEGNVKAYASTDPDFIPEDTPVAMTDIADQKLTIVTPDPTRRYYYTLVFAGKYRVKTATRNINIPGIQNFRDLGGYPSYSTRKETRRGMLYRSAQPDDAGEETLRELKNIGIKTVIDLRSTAEAENDSALRSTFNVVCRVLFITSPSWWPMVGWWRWPVCWPRASGQRKAGRCKRICRPIRKHG